MDGVGVLPEPQALDDGRTVLSTPVLDLWIAGRVPSPNQLWRLTPVAPRRRSRSRWSVVEELRTRADVVALVTARSVHVDLVPPVRMIFQVFRKYWLDSDQAVYAVKHYRDAIVKRLLPGSHDGPLSGNVFDYRPMIRVATDSDEGVRVQIFPLTHVDASRG